MSALKSGAKANAIAIVGMSGRFPQSPTLTAYWRNIRDGVECLTRFNDEALASSGLPEALWRNPAFVPVHGVVDEHDQFAASFFGINPREAELTDPQQRLLLEVAWEAMEDAGYDPERTSGPVGVYVGVGMNKYLFTQILRAKAALHPGSAYEVFIGNDKDFSATRISYKLGLQGPSVNVQTACSTSLVAVHLACQALLNFQCDIALAGAASVAAGSLGYTYSEGMILSPDGHCRPFDVQAKGTVPGDGVGIVVLKRLDDALTDGDAVRAVILGIGVNNDGSLKAGFTAPSVEGQREAIVMAQAMAEIEPDTISYIEAHGTATPLGDPIEIAALTRAFRERTAREGFCAIGSVKGNIGHTDTVAGVAGLIKTVLALEHRVIPPSLHYTTPNPALDLPHSPFFVNVSARDWPQQGGAPRRASVSSFGIGGTNAHAILEEAPANGPRRESTRWQVLTLSARSPDALDAMTVRLRDHLSSHTELVAADVAFTLQEGRRPFSVRRTVVCASRDAAVAALQADHSRAVHTGRVSERPPLVAFMFTGQGSQYPGMGAGLFESEPVFRAAVDDCAVRFRSMLGADVRNIFLSPAPGDPSIAARLTRTLWAQPSLFTLEYALAQLWLARGVEPDAMIGHSLGEYVAATLAGVFTLDDATRLVAVRARLMEDLPAGAMTAVPLSEAVVAAMLPAELSLAAVNGPVLVVVSGPTEAITSFERDLVGRGTTPRRLHTSHAFHSAMVEPMLDAFRDELARTTFSPPIRRYVSNVTGGWITAAEATAPDYWLRHLRSPVRFTDGIDTLMMGERVLLELGPGRTLASLARQGRREAMVVSSVRHPDDSESDGEVFARATGALWSHGVPIVWPATHAGEVCVRVPLPTYPFERQRFWIEATTHVAEPPVDAPGAVVGPLPKRPELASWFYQPSWARTPLPQVRASQTRIVCVALVDSDGMSDRLVAALQQRGAEVVTVRPGPRFSEDGIDDFRVRPGSREDCDQLCARLAAQQRVPNRVVDLWPLSLTADAPQAATLDRGYHALVALLQALHDRIPAPRHFVVFGRQIHDVTTGDVVLPLAAVITGPCRAMPLEYANHGCTLIDCGEESDRAETIAAFAAEVEFPTRDVIVAYRRGRRWVQRFEAAPIEAAEGPSIGVRERGVYLITGGMGGIGLALARDLATREHARLVLVGRTALPPRKEWDARPSGDVFHDAIQMVRTLEDLWRRRAGRGRRCRQCRGHGCRRPGRARTIRTYRRGHSWRRRAGRGPVAARRARPRCRNAQVEGRGNARVGGGAVRGSAGVDAPLFLAQRDSGCSRWCGLLRGECISRRLRSST